jgi:hypothetical protein
MCTLGFHLVSLYTGELNFEQTILNKTKALLGTSRGTHLETLWELRHFGNMMGTHWEQEKKNKKSLSTIPPPLPQKEKN